ncbi:MAG: COR domain-containing protein [Cyanobacteria bacterium P01_G01_bin.54]
MSQERALALIAQAKAEGWKTLDLAGLRLTALPAEIGELVELEELVLGKRDDDNYELVGNRSVCQIITNPITDFPNEIAQLKNLKRLNLSGLPLKILPHFILQLSRLSELILTRTQLRELPPEIGQLKSLTKLSLSFNTIKELPSEIVQLQNLTQLYFSFNGLKEPPPEIFQLHSLIQLLLNDNTIEELSSEISQLKSLTCLNLSFNNLKILPLEIFQLKKLTELGIRSNSLKELHPGIRQLQNLTSLGLGYNDIKRLPLEIFQLKKLTSLGLGGNDLKNLPFEIGQLQKLTQLDLSYNELKKIPTEIFQFKNLTELYFSRNGLTELPSEITQLKSLTELYLSYNEIRELPSEIVQLQKLASLNLFNNELREIPELIKELANLKQLDLRGNPLPIPPEVLGSREPWKAPGDLKTILDFYLSIQDLPESDPLYEAKLLIVGEGGAGKTSLAQKLLNPDYELQESEKSTEGIDVLRWEFPHPDGHDFRTNIWDFGGQEIYHATHQFFLTKRSLYLLVADTREQSTDFYYWLKIIELLSDNSPVLIIKNEKQNRQCQINDRALRGEFTNLQEIFVVNLADNRGLETLKTAIQQYISRLEHVGTPMPGHWVRIRAVLENYAQTRNYIDLNEYFDLCRQNGFDDRDRMLAVSQYLHDLGICLHFQTVKLLKKTVILKPEWATGAVYNVLDTDKIQNNFGRFSDDDLADIWHEGDTAEMRDELLALMQEFELCYEIPGCKGRYIAPQLLSNEQPQYDWDDNENLILRYRYDFKPKDILPRFIVAMHEQIEDQCLVWKHGVVLTNGYARAEIIEEDRYHKAEIKIRVSGSNKRHLLSIAAHELEKIQNGYERLEYQTLIPCNCQMCKGSQTPYTYPWDVLQRFQRDRRDEIQCIQSYDMVNVRGLLDGVIEQPLSRETFEFGMKGEPYQRRSPFDKSFRPAQDEWAVTTTTHVNVPQPMGDTHIHQHGQGDNYAGDNVGRDKIGTQINNAPDLTQAAKEIKSLLEQLSGDYDLSSPTGQMMVGAKAVEAIENNPTLKQRVVAALQASGETALDELIDHPAAKICLAGAKGFIMGGV